MKLTFHGAARTVTGSQHLIEVNGSKILLDCGLFQGRRKDAFEINRNLPFEPASIDALVLSHAHIDHSGNIPNLVKNGFRGNIVCTFATRDLCSVMLRDSGHIHEYDAQWLNKKRARKGEPPIEPIYTELEAVEALKYFTAVGYDRPNYLTPDVDVSFCDAGHILGSAIVILDIIDREAKRPVRLVFSGDLGRYDMPILRDPTVITDADVLIMESTYGNRSHALYPDTEKELERIVKETYARRGSVIVPSFAVGRTQQLVYSLHQMHERGDLPDIPVYVDSPLAINATGVFRLHPEAFDRETLEFMERDQQRDVFGFDRLRYTRSTRESKEINKTNEPAIIISASGMAEAGRILHHLKNKVTDERNTVLIVGWQAPHTLGRRIVEKQPKVKILGEEYALNARVEILNGFSGHADHDGLLDWARGFKEKPQHTFLVHGEEDSALALADGLRSGVGYENVAVPELHQSFEI
jgi:metallo-beta-lactamase family protein